MPDVHVLSLDERQLAEAYPLVRSAAHVALAEWRAFGLEAIAGNGGVLGARVDDGCIYGVATFAPRAALRHGRALHVEVLIAIELGGSAPVLEALCADLARVARALECQSIVFAGPSVPRALATAAPPIPNAHWNRVIEKAVVLTLKDGSGETLSVRS